MNSSPNLFWLVKDTFLSEIVSNNTINPTWRVFEKVHQHNRIYHGDNITVKRLIRVSFLPTKTLICCNKRNHNFIFYTLSKTLKIRRRRLTDSWLWLGRKVMTRKVNYDQLVMSRNWDFFSGLSELYRIFSKMTEFMGSGGFFFYQFCLLICCTEDHTCTVVNNGTCAVLSAHTVNWRQRSFIQVFYVSVSVLSIDRCYKLFLP